MTRPPNALKAFCDELAAAACSPVGSRLLRGLQLAGLFGRLSGQAPASGHAGEPAAAPASRDRVGIWERTGEDAASGFVRRMDLLAEWSYWGNVGRIEPKGTRRRVVLIGESAARGYLYDPEYTPAMVLTELLESHWQRGSGNGRGGSAAVEVVDLARTNLGFEVRELTLSALLLEPDAVVVFAGNNWRVSTSDADLPRLGPVMQAEGVPGLKRLAEERVAGDVRRLLEDLGGAYAAASVPLLWIVPESNLGDWRDPATQAPHLAQDANRRWLDRWLAASTAASAGDLDAAAALSRQMVELDRGVSVTGLYMLAEHSLHGRDLDAARRYLELARDAVIWDGSRVVSPRPYSVAQDVLRREAPTHGIRIVDLPGIFRQYLDGGLPGRRLFLDYCHLTSEGIQVAMAAAAAAVLDAVAGMEVSWRGLLDDTLAPSLEVEAGAALLAAIHNAHWWQRYEVVHHHCTRAVRAAPEIAQVIRRFIEIQIRRAPMDMCKPAEELAELGSPLLRHYLLRFNNQQLDRLLIAALVAALREVGDDDDAWTERLLREERSLRHGAADLLDYYYSSAALQPQEAMWVTPRDPEEVSRLAFPDYYKAYAPESRFVFVGEAGRQVRLRLTCRLPEPWPLPPGSGVAALALNGQPVAERVVGRPWTTWDVLLAGERVLEGANEVSIRWPIPEFAGERALATVVDDLLDGLVPNLYPVFGEIHSFTAADAALDPPRPPERRPAPAADEPAQAASR